MIHNLTILLRHFWSDPIRICYPQKIASQVLPQPLAISCKIWDIPLHSRKRIWIDKQAIGVIDRRWEEEKRGSEKCVTRSVSRKKHETKAKRKELYRDGTLMQMSDQRYINNDYQRT